MNGFGGYTPFLGIPNGGAQQQLHGISSGTHRIGSISAAQRTLVMAKRDGERSFGMTLEQQRDVSSSDYPYVSYVFPNSPASRAGLLPGWAFIEVNGYKCVGRSVTEVASVFRGLPQVTMVVDTTNTKVVTMVPTIHQLPTFSIPPAVTLPPLATAVAYPTPGSIASSSVVSRDIPQSAVSVTTTPPIVAATTATATVPFPVVASSAALTCPSVNVVASLPAASLPRSASSEFSPVGLNSAHHVVEPSVVATTALPALQAVTAPIPAPRALNAQPSVVPTQSQQLNQPVAPVASLSNASQNESVAPPPSVSQQPRVSNGPVQAQPSLMSPTPSTTQPAASTPLQPTQSRSSGKKRARVQTEQPAASAPPTSATAAASTPPSNGPSRQTTPTSKKRSRPPKKRATPATEYWDSDDAVYFMGSDAEVEEVSSPPANSRGRRSSRQAESGGRARRSLTVARLMTMGFTQEDSEASVEACGQDPDKCMLWIVAHIEEKQFLNDLNKASIESEQQKQIDAQEQRRHETETIEHTTAFTSLFPLSFILSEHAEAPRLKEMLSVTIGNIAADTLIRTLMTKLLTVEGKAIRWYKQAAKCYMLQLASRLEVAFDAHDVVSCCSQVMATEPVDSACTFVRALREEENALTKALFSMPENHGGVPLEFLHADDSMQFSLDDDGFEVVEIAPTSP